MRIGLTRRDIADYGQMGAGALWAMGCRPGDIVFECMNFNLYSGGLSDHLTFETLGAATTRRGRAQRAAALDDGRAAPIRSGLGDAVVCRAAGRGGRRARDRAALVGLRRAAGPGRAFQGPGYRDRIEDTWGMVARDSTAPASSASIRANATSATASTTAAPG